MPQDAESVMKISFIDEGIRKSENGDIIVDNKNDYETDMIKTVSSLELYKSNIGNNVYYFGYSLNNDIQDNHYRSEVIEWLKTRKELDKDLDCFFCRPLSQLVKEVGNIDLVLYPKSNRSELVPLIIEALWRTMPNGSRYSTMEAVKNLPKNITVNWDRVKSKYPKDNEFVQVEKNLNNLLKDIHSLDYFSLSDNVKKKYRGFISEFLTLGDDDYVLKEIEDGNLLIIDDINTSGSTINELIRIAKSINPSCNIYIYTLIGKQ